MNLWEFYTHRQKIHNESEERYRGSRIRIEATARRVPSNSQKLITNLFVGEGGFLAAVENGNKWVRVISEIMRQQSSMSI